MQNVSEAWKSAQTQSIVPESFVEITYSVGDPSAQSDAAAIDYDVLINPALTHSIHLYPCLQTLHSTHKKSLAGSRCKIECVMNADRSSHVEMV